MSTIENPVLDSAIQVAIDAYRRSKAPIWKRVRKELEKSRSRRSTVNIEKISRSTKSGNIVLVPGKVLGAGELTHKVIVGAFSFSQTASEKISKKRGKALTLAQFAKKYPDGKGVILIGG